MRVKTYRLIRHEGYPALEQTNGINYQGVCGEPAEVYRLMCDVFGLDNSMEEIVYAVFFDNRQHPLGFSELGHGGFDSSFLDMKSLFTRALLFGAVGIILVHNHPFGVLKPSKEDELITERVTQGCGILDINLLDHIIIGGEQYFSFKEQDLL